MSKLDLSRASGGSILLAVEPLPSLLRKHFLEPVGAGSPEGADARGGAANSACGDRLELGLWLEGSRVARARFQAGGCSALIAAASLVCERLVGVPAAELADIDPRAWLREAGGLPRRGAHAGLVVQRALAEAVRGLPARYP
ncbi:MAG TPA: iron-sulfur cluster assembly scaffold protein [Planctomycetota bacterium]|nr:iron-sulfur cluster assembly scaffold protein [Planctomycetota bacterium]